MATTAPQFLSLAVCQTAYNTLFAAYHSEDSHAHEEEGDGHEGHFHGGVGDCDGAEKEWTAPLHIASIFIVLAVSILGTGFPIVSTHIKQLRVPKYVIIFGKCIGIGVVLSVAIIHMLLPGILSLSSECLPESWTEGYEAWGYLFCVLAITVMHFIDFVVLSYIKHRQSQSSDIQLKNSSELKEIQTPGGSEDSHGHKHEHTPGNDTANCHAGHAGHIHGGLLMDPAALKTIEAYFLEFGITVHSVLIGLAVGVVDDTILKTLLVALAFHQFFEGVALGSRIADAKLESHWHEVLLVSIYSFSAPIGIAIGVGVSSSLNVNSQTFLYIQGVFDSVCAGILIYIGINLMMKDFPEDMEEVTKGRNYQFILKCGLFVALWIGIAVMAIIGKYL